MLLFEFFNITVHEDIGNGYADGDGYDDRDCFDTAAQAVHKCSGIDGADIDELEEQAVEQYSGNHRDSGWNREDDVGGMEPMDGLERENTYGSSTEEGAGSLTHAELQHGNVAQADSEDAAKCKDGQQAAGNIEDHGKADGSNCRGNCLREIDFIRLQADTGEVGNIAQPDGNHDAEGHAANDEQGIDCAGRAGDDVVVQQVVYGIDERDAWNDKERAGNHRVPGSS